MTSYIPYKGQVTVRYFGLYAYAHRRWAEDTNHEAFPLRMMMEKLLPILSEGWAEMIRKVC